MSASAGCCSASGSTPPRAHATPNSALQRPQRGGAVKAGADVNRLRPAMADGPPEDAGSIGRWRRAGGRVKFAPARMRLLNVDGDGGGPRAGYTAGDGRAEGGAAAATDGAAMTAEVPAAAGRAPAAATGSAAGSAVVAAARATDGAEAVVKDDDAMAVVGPGPAAVATESAGRRSSFTSTKRDTPAVQRHWDIGRRSGMPGKRRHQPSRGPPSSEPRRNGGVHVVRRG